MLNDCLECFRRSTGQISFYAYLLRCCRRKVLRWRGARGGSRRSLYRRLADERLRMVEARWDTEVVRLYIRMMANPRDEARRKRFLSGFQRWHDEETDGKPCCEPLPESAPKSF